VDTLRQSLNVEKQKFKKMRSSLMTLTDPYENRNNYIYNINVRKDSYFFP